MLSYLSKFVLQMLPTISATVIGAYIVTTWINPKTPPEPGKVAARAAEPASPALAPEAEAKGADVAKAVTTNDTIRIVPIVRQPAAGSNAAASTTATAPDPVAAEHKTASDLARAAIQRLRGSGETARPAEHAARPAPQPRGEQARAAKETAQPAPVAAVAPPLPPPVAISSLRYPREGDEADQASIAEPDRFAPPAEIPAERSAVGLQASHRVAESPSFADDFLTATRTFFRAFTPPQQ